MYTVKISSERLDLGQLSFFVLLAVVIFMTAISTPADAKGLRRGGDIPNWGGHPSRAEARLNVMGHWSDNVESRLQGVCYDMLEKEDKPYYLYLGLQFGVLEPVVGWSFRDNEWVTGLRSYPQWETWRGYTNFEYQLETKSFYYLAQAEARISPLIECGAEIEGWGDIDDHQTSNGIGLNMVFSLHGHHRWKAEDSMVFIEAAIQYRELGGEWKSQVVVRFTFTPHLDEHTRSKRRH